MSERAPRSSPTLEDVARAAGTSRATVSRVINGIRNVDPAIQEAVRRAIAATGYVPNRAARSLVTRRADSLALVVSGAGDEEGQGGEARGGLLADPFFGRTAGGVIGALRPRGMHPVLMLADSAEARRQVVASLRQGGADGALLVSTHAADPLPEQLVHAGVPAVMFARPPRPIPVSYVDFAHHDGARLAADHLVARGCRRVATITGPLDVLASQDRLAGFREAMARHGHPYVPTAEGAFTLESGERVMARLLAEHPDLDGVFVANDLMAQGALHVLREAGRRVPGDVAVVGFDDSSAAVSSRPALTTVRQPVEDMAAEMTRLLLELIETPGREPASVIFEPVLVVRQSA
ncbi:LacI family DNA-binding transcriptional regulator [Streptomyces hoynatensis]|uniref:LacI family transcriptional regulator n=1 Tax=Streptomyces hoynatensis TaxID=1141874 RepID=A0A3A9YP42_9ACTN|nr:LacI family DNA-binding transcriptional regulator [Streptomyces hoynatensis]RKN37214.1 LacI family transcriptional regulator [Streptomyces hoynatensis]